MLGNVVLRTFREDARSWGGFHPNPNMPSGDRKILWIQIGLKDLSTLFPMPLSNLVGPSLTFDWICLFISVALYLLK